MQTKNLLISAILFGFLLGNTNAIQAQKQGRKKRIAVFTLEDKSDSNWSWWGRKSVGQGITDMVITDLVKTGKYSVIERDRLNELLREQDLGGSGIVTQASAAEAGKVLGVELAIFGAVTEFGYKNSKTGLNVPKTGIRIGKQAAVAALDLRIVNTTTGEILTAENVRRQKSALAGGVRHKGFSFDNQKSFDESLVGKVTRNAIEDVIKLIDDTAVNIPWQAKVITMNGGKVYINSGAEAGVEVGEVFSVYRPGQELVDPDTGLSLGAVEEKVGMIKVLDNSSVGNGKAAICEVVEGSGFQKGDIVKDN